MEEGGRKRRGGSGGEHTPWDFQHSTNAIVMSIPVIVPRLSADVDPLRLW